MKKVIVLSLCSAIVLSGCNTAEGMGAYSGASLGSILGSAIGGISGGPRGSDIGTIIGMAGGAVVGAAAGSAAEQAQQEKYRQYQEKREARYGRGYQRRGNDNSEMYPQRNDDSGFDPTNSGDDRISMEPATGDESTYTTVKPQTITPEKSVSVDQLASVAPGYSFKYNALIEVRNASFVDDNGDGVLRAGEVSKVTFEIMNNSDVTLYDVQPTVIETTGNKHIHVSPSLHVESIAPHKGVRYTATVAADNRLKDGQAALKVAVAQGDKEITSQVKEFVIETRRK